MSFKSFNSRIVVRILAALAPLVAVFLTADYLIPGAKATKYGYDKKGRLTSNGYGNITPMTPYAKFLCALANMTEFFFTVVFFNTLLSLRRTPHYYTQ
jgi:hypothetical protein